MHPDVASYIESCAEPARQRLRQLDEMIRAAFPRAAAQLYNGQFPVYLIDGEWAAGFAQRSKGPMLYVMDQAVVAKYRDRLGTLADGKSCVLVKPTKTLPEAELLALVHTMLTEVAEGRNSL